MFFFKQKTAYEMRISDWSSDVCSSDLHRDLEQDGVQPGARYGDGDFAGLLALADGNAALGQVEQAQEIDEVTFDKTQTEIGRASCRERVFSTCRSRWSPYH